MTISSSPSAAVVTFPISTTVRVDEDGDMGEYLLPPPGWKTTSCPVK